MQRYHTAVRATKDAALVFASAFQKKPQLFLKSPGNTPCVADNLYLFRDLIPKSGEAIAQR
ncbi:MAG: hypothetical protein WCH61_10200, partial [bacterium]